MGEGTGNNDCYMGSNDLHMASEKPKLFKQTNVNTPVAIAQIQKVISERMGLFQCLSSC